MFSCLVRHIWASPPTPGPQIRSRLRDWGREGAGVKSLMTAQRWVNAKGCGTSRSTDAWVKRGVGCLFGSQLVRCSLSSLHPSLLSCPYDPLIYRASLLILTRQPALPCPAVPPVCPHPHPHCQHQACLLPLGKMLPVRAKTGSREKENRETHRKS